MDLTPFLFVRILTACLAVLQPLPACASDRLEGLEFKHGIAFFHELKYPPDYTHMEYLNPDAPKGGELVLPTQSNFDTFAPMAERGTGAPGSWLRNDRLIRRGGDELSAFYGSLADGIAITDDRLTMVFRMHPMARWRDGVPITSNDVAYTLQVYLNQVSGRLYFNFFDSIEKIDDRHLAIHLKVPLKLHHVMVLLYIPIIPAHSWHGKDPSAPTLDPPLTSGPYEIVDFNQGRFIEYRRDPEYWGKDIPINRGRYNFDTIRFEVYRDATVTREAFRKGLIDIWNETDVNSWHSAFDTPALEKGWVKKIRRKQGLEVGVRKGIVLNNRREKFKDRRVRLALALAIDFEWQNKTLHYGDLQRAHSYWPNTVLAATGLPSDQELALLAPYRDQLPPELFLREFRFPEVISKETYRSNILRARELLSQAGWHVVDGVLSNSAGDIFEIEFLSSRADDARVLLPYFQRLEQLGIHGIINIAQGSSQWMHRLRKFDFDALLVSMTIQMPPLIGLRDRFHSEAALIPTSANRSGISNQVVDFLVDKARFSTSMEEMIATCRALDRVLLWQYYQIPLYAIDRPRTVHWNKFGSPDYEPVYQPAFPEGWWYEPEKAARIQTGSPL